MTDESIRKIEINEEEPNARLFDSSPELRLYGLRSVLIHLANSGQESRFRSLLSNFDFIHAKLTAFGSQSVVADYDLPLSNETSQSAAGINDDDPLRQIQRAIRISASVVDRDSSQFASQLLGRLPATQTPVVAAILEQASKWPGSCGLRPVKASLLSSAGPLLRTMQSRQPKGVRLIAITPDDTNLVVAFADQSLEVWDLASGALVRTLTGHVGRVQAIAITADGCRVVCALNQELVCVWDLNTGQLLGKHYGLKAPILLTPDGGFVIAVSKEGELKLWDLESGKLVRTIKIDDDPLCTAVITPDGSKLVGTCESHLLKVWSLKKGRVIRVLEDHNLSLTALAVTPDGKHVVASSREGLRIWRLASGRILRTLAYWGTVHHTITITADGTHAVSTADAYDKRNPIIQVWNLARGTLKSTFECPVDVHGVAITWDAKNAVTYSGNEPIRVWDLTAPSQLEKSESHSDGTFAVVIPDAYNWAISVSADKTIKLWDTKTGKMVRTHESRWGDIHAMAAIPGEPSQVAVGLEDGTVRILDLLPDWLEVKKVFGGYTPKVSALAISPDGDKLVYACEDHKIRVWNIRNNKELYAFEGHNDRIRSIAITPDATKFVTGSVDEALKVWDLVTGKLLHNLHAGAVFSVAITPDSSYVFASEFRFITLWDINQGFPLRVFTEHTGPTYGLAVSSDGAFFVSVSQDRTLKLWDVESRESLKASPGIEYGKSIATFTADSLLTSVAIALIGRTIVAGDRTGNLHFLEIVDNRNQTNCA